MDCILLLTAWLLIGSWQTLPHTRQATQEQSAEKTNRNAKENEPWLTKDAAGFFAFWLVIVGSLQAGLFYVQLKLIRKTLVPAETAATAARDAVTAQTSEFLASNRPKIRIKHVFLANEFRHDTPFVATIVCVNTGTTEAIITEYGATFIVVNEGRQIPFFPALQVPPIVRGAHFQLECGISLHLPNILNAIMLTNAQHASIRNGEAKLFGLGYVHYLDSAGRIRSTGFCRVLTFPDNPVASDNGRFRVFPDPDYEYQD